MRNALFLSLLSSTVLLAGCASSQPVHQQQYANLRSTKTFDFEMPVVWKGIERTFQNYQISERDPSEVDALEMKKLSKRSLETEWVYSESRDKFVEYRMNDLPRRKYLQVRLKYKVTAERVMGGTQVSVKMDEEVEDLRADGTSKGFSGTEQPDSSRTNEILEKIQGSILAAEP